MSGRLISTAVLIAAAAAAQQPPQRFYARAIYTKWKPGMQAEGQTFLKGVPSKAALNWVKAESGAVGQLTMSRVLPGGGEIPYDRLRLVITSEPPDLGGARQPTGAYLEGTGMQPADYAAKLRSMMDVVKTEIWESVFRLGSVKAGDYVVVALSKPPAGKTADKLRHLRDWESAMGAEIVKSGRTTGMDAWQVRFANGDYPYTFASLVVYPDSESVYKGLGSRQEVFHKAHPGKDYHAYRELADAVRGGGQTVIYRVDMAVWK